MKVCAVLTCLCLGAITSANNVETNRLPHVPLAIDPDEIIFQIFEMLKWMIKNGSPDVFPVLDPMMLPDQTFQMSLPNKMFTINANYSNGILRGLGDFEVHKVEFVKSEISVYLAVNFPELTLTAEQYEMEGDIYAAIPLAGHGSFRFQVSNFNFSSKIYIKQSEDGESAIVDKFEDTQYSIDKISSRTEFDKNIDDIFNSLVDDLLAYNLSRFNKLILMKYTDTVLEALNAYLDQFDTWRFIDAIL